MGETGFRTYAGAPSPEELAGYDLNDFGNGLRLIRLAGGAIDDAGEVDAADARLLYLLGSGWIGFNGKYWDRKFGEDLARRTAHLVAQKVRGVVAEIEGRGISKKEAYKFADSCGSSGATSAMLRQAQSYLTVEIDAFDRDPLALNCRNGTLKMQVAGKVKKRLKVELSPHHPADRITRMADVEYDPKAAAPLFAGVVADSFAPLATDRGEAAEEAAYFHRVLGYSTTGFIHEQAFFLVQGPGRDGKSTILDAVRQTLGGYGETGSVLSFLDTGLRGGGDHNTDLVKLAGDVRLAILSEPPRGAKLNEGLLKQWTSGSPVTARELREKPFNFLPAAKLVWECNNWPVAKGDDDGIWRRLKAIPFRNQVPEGQVDRLMPAKLKAERAGILNWLIEGIEAWLCGGEDGDAKSGGGGLREPPSCRKLIEDYRRTSSPFGDWLSERCIWGKAAAGCRTLTAELYTDYKHWAEDQGLERPMSVRAFGDALADRQIALAGKNAKGLKMRGPIRLKDPAELLRELRAAEAAAAAGASSNGASTGGFEGYGGPEPGADLDEFDA